jgi:putative hydrolases of HD superfamily
VPVDFFYELGQLKRVKRSGWWLAGVKDPETVAEHSFRAAAIGYILAHLEKVDPDKVMLMCLFNDLHETRLNDLHKVGHRYIDFKAAEPKAFLEQMKGLPDDVGGKIQAAFLELHKQASKEGIVARDADLLECAVQAKEYMAEGHYACKDWIANISKNLATDSAKKLLKDIENTDPYHWWEGLKNAKR